MKLDFDKIESEIIYKASRSSGKGGQHVNKVSTRIEAKFNVSESFVLTDEQKKTIMKKLSSKLDSEGNLRTVSQKHRSQLKNKKETAEKIFLMLEKALVKEKKRLKTKVSKNAKAKRVENKKKKGEIKKLRKTPIIKDE